MQSEALMERYLEEVVRLGRVELIDEMALPDMVDEANQAFGGPPGRAGLVAHVKGFHRCIHDFEMEVIEIVGGNDHVMAWWQFSGVHAGPWLGQTPTNEVISATVFSFFHLENGLVSRYRLWLNAGFREPMVFDSRLALAAKQS